MEVAPLIFGGTCPAVMRIIFVEPPFIFSLGFHVYYACVLVLLICIITINSIFL